jgi:uncharacterized protein YbjT (DUF2867 family)
MRIAVTGANGLVGLAVCTEAARQGFVPIGVVRSQESAASLRAAGVHAEIVPQLHDRTLVGALQGADAVLHLAQIGKQTTTETFEHVNIDGTRSVIEAARRAGVRRVAYFSGLGVAHYGMTRHCTNAYFLSKLACEVELFRSGLEHTVFRPSYIVGPGSGFLRSLLREMEAGELTRVGDGQYRLQPIALQDVAQLVLAALQRPVEQIPCVYDLVGPEPISFNQLLSRLGEHAHALGRRIEYRVREVAVDEAMRQARSSGYRGMRGDDLDCLLCDEVSDPVPLERLLGRSLTPLDAALEAALQTSDEAH